MEAALALLFEDPRSEDATRWYSQAFCFHEDVLVQNRGGPCGVLAAVQAHVVLHDKFLSPGSSMEQCLKLAVFGILHRASAEGSVVLAKRSQTGEFSPNDPVELVECKSLEDVEFQQSEMFDPSSLAGIMVFVLSLLFTKSLAKVREEMDDSEAKLTGRFGHCGQEVLNLILTGRGSSQLHDFALQHESGLTLHGVYSRPQVGLLTQLETYRLVQVGSFLKNPQFPIWVIASESHFTVLYSEDRNCDVKSSVELVLENAKRVFHTKDVQDNGFVQHADLEAILAELFEGESGESVRLFIQAKFPGADIVLWTDFWQRVGGLLERGLTLESQLPATWPCLACTFVNAPTAKQCDMCLTAKPASSSPPQPPPPAAAAASQAAADWICSKCTLTNPPSLEYCMMCGTGKQPKPLRPDTLSLYHVNGLQRTVHGEVILPARSGLISLTTVEPTMAYNGSASAFEEVLQTKWTGAVFDYHGAGSPPSIVG